MWAVVGLGNPGRCYAGTRHNAGFLFVRRLAKDWGVRLNKNRFLAKTAELRGPGPVPWLILPQTFMNRSGASVRPLRRESRVDPERLIVVFDDLDIPLGEIRVRGEGGPGTHKGMRSVVDEAETGQFPRIRLEFPRAPARGGGRGRLRPVRIQAGGQNLVRGEPGQSPGRPGPDPGRPAGQAMNRYN